MNEEQQLKALKNNPHYRMTKSQEDRLKAITSRKRKTTKRKPKKSTPSFDKNDHTFQKHDTSLEEVTIEKVS